MKTRKPKAPKAVPETYTVGPDPKADVKEEEPKDTVQVQPEEKRERTTFGFDVNADGSPDFSSMRGKTKEKFRQFLNDPRVIAEFGIGASSPISPQIECISPAMVSGFYHLLGHVEAEIFGAAMKLPPGIAQRVFLYNEQEKALLVPPTTRVINKYAPEWLIKYQDEITLATLLVQVTVAKVSVARVMVRQTPPPVSTPSTPSQAKSEENSEKPGVEGTGIN